MVSAILFLFLYVNGIVKYGSALFLIRFQNGIFWSTNKIERRIDNVKNLADWNRTHEVEDLREETCLLRLRSIHMF